MDRREVVQHNLYTYKPHAQCIHTYKYMLARKGEQKRQSMFTNSLELRILIPRKHPKYLITTNKYMDITNKFENEKIAHPERHT